MAEKELADNRTTKHKTKDSVFSRLFTDRKNILELYRDLHPEDTTTTIDDIQPETLETIFINEIYNDLGFIVNDVKHQNMYFCLKHRVNGRII